MNTIELLISLVRSFGLLTIMVFLYSEILRWGGGPSWLRRIIPGVLFGIGAVFSMVQVQLMPGILIDARLTLLGLAGVFGGYEAALISAIFASAYQIWLGGPGVVPGVVGIVLAASIGCLFKAFVRVAAERLTLRQLISLGMLLNLSMINCLLLPPEMVQMFVKGALGPLATATVLGVVIFGSFLGRERRRQKASEALKLAATTDSLTQLANRRAFRKHLTQAVRKSVAEGTPLSLLILDADHFKQINDLYGHDVGDIALSELGRTIKDQLRPQDLAARIGGEEFGVILTKTSIDDAVKIADQIRRAVEMIEVPLLTRRVSLTISVGAAQLSMVLPLPGDIMKAADRALYQAKANGRNQVAVLRDEWAKAA